jgi:TetR/AcrR family transcriptional regulator, mexJK operon transcriptional repressor
MAAGIEMTTQTATETGSSPRRGGRPTRDAAAALGERIVAVATQLFLEHGFGATSIEAIAEAAGISKRTFYHRFRDKPDLFRAVVRRMIARWALPAEALVIEGPLEDTLHRAAKQILAAALSPEALRLYRILIAEAPRFPELAAITNEQGAAGWRRLATFFEDEARAQKLALSDPAFAAEQFANMVLAGPRRRALGLGPAMSAAELDAWTKRTVALFLDGMRARNGTCDGVQ